MELNLAAARILIVDDETANVCLLENMLGRFGYSNLRSITDSRQVMKQVSDFHPDLIILDLMMPHINGHEILSQIGQRISREILLPVLVLTSDASPTARRKALAGGATDFLLKPFDAMELLVRIRTLLSMRFLQLQLQKQNQQLEEKVAERTHELSETMAQLRDTQRQVVQQERLRAFGEMAGGIVHDFNNSLMCIIGYSELLLQDEAMLDEKQTVLQYLKTMNTAGRDAANVVGRLREFYRPREESDVFAPVSLNEIIEEVVPMTQPKWKDQALASGRRINFEFDLEKLPPVAGDAAELREAVTNLIFNAVDAMPQGGTITLRTRRKADRVALEISDTGIGMGEEIRSRCLEPFFSTKGDNGTGLGLSMVFGIIQRHDGRLEVESAPGKGTTFRIQLPSQVPTFEPALENRKPPPRQLNILIADDEAVVRDVLQKYLTADGHKVVSASSGEEALERFRSQHFDILLTDQGMPGMSGLELAAAAKEISNQPVILLSGFHDQKFTTGETPPGVDLALKKPIPHQALRNALAAVLQPAEECVA